MTLTGESVILTLFARLAENVTLFRRIIDWVELLCPLIQDGGSCFKAQSLGFTGTRQGDCLMNKARVHAGLTLFVVIILCGASTTLTFGQRRPFGIITGSVRDHQGKPVAGALVSLVQEGAAGKAIKQTTERG